MALAALGAVSHFHTFYFPRDSDRHQEEALFPETLEPSRFEDFKETYTGFLRKIAMRSPGRMHLLKNQVSTTRIPILEKWFPGSRFIHVVTEPGEVGVAALNRIRTSGRGSSFKRMTKRIWRNTSFPPMKR